MRRSTTAAGQAEFVDTAFNRRHPIRGRASRAGIPPLARRKTAAQRQRRDEVASMGPTKQRSLIRELALLPSSENAVPRGGVPGCRDEGSARRSSCVGSRRLEEPCRLGRVGAVVGADAVALQVEAEAGRKPRTSSARARLLRSPRSADSANILSRQAVCRRPCGVVCPACRLSGRGWKNRRRRRPRRPQPVCLALRADRGRRSTADANWSKIPHPRGLANERANSMQQPSQFLELLARRAGRSERLISFSSGANRRGTSSVKSRWRQNTSPIKTMRRRPYRLIQ